MNKTTFTENFEENKLIAVRKFNAPLEKVWKAFSDEEILCQWWAPHPYTCDIKFLDFRTGGHWIYWMTGPEGDVHKARMDFQKIDLHNVIDAEAYFCDDDGEKTGDIPPMQFEVSFEGAGEVTTVTAVTSYVSLEAFKQMAEMGAAEGWELSTGQLEKLLAK